MGQTDTVEPVVRVSCPDCGEELVARDAAWVAHARASHRCPTPAEPITRALRGEFDG